MIKILRQFKGKLLIVLFSLLSLKQLYASINQMNRPPNVIIIFMDDMGYGDLSSYGHPTILTPHIDRMASEGQKWTNFYTASSVCSPSRGALLTGRYPVRIGLTGKKQRVFFPNSYGGLPQSEVTIAEMLKANGYQTGIIGKWHLGHLPQYTPDQQGFDYFYGLPYSNDMNPLEPNHQHIWNPLNPKNWNSPLLENITVVEQPVDQSTLTKRYTEKSIKFIEHNKEQPFFLYLAHAMVHVPLFAHKEFKGSSPRGLYGDVMNEIDWSVGQILQTLERLKLEKNTLVIFTSDNGPWLSYKEMGGSAGLLRGGKGTTWEGGMRVPGIFYMPGTIDPGVISDLGATLDILPTIASITGAQLPEDKHLDGFDLLPVLSGKAKSKRDHFIYYRKDEIYAVRKNEYKLHYITEECYQANNNRQDLSVPLLYHINADPSEKYNLGADFPSIVEEINQLVSDHQKTIIHVNSELDKRD